MIIDVPVVMAGGIPFKLVMSDLVELKSNIDIDPKERALMSVFDVMRFCLTPEGVPLCLIQARKHEDPHANRELIDSIMTPAEQIQVVNDLVNLFMGVPGGDAGDTNPSVAT